MHPAPAPLLLPANSASPVCTENLNSDVMVMQSADERMGADAADPLRPAHLCSTIGAFWTHYSRRRIRPGSGAGAPRPRRQYGRHTALRAAPFALTGAHVGQSGLTDPGERSANKSCVSPVRCASPVAPPSQQRSNVESRGSGRLRCNCIRKVSPTRNGAIADSW